MLTKTLAATAALSTLVVGGAAVAAPQARSSTMVGPKQPIPYSQLKAYSKASPKVRADKDWWAGSAMASTGTQADTAANAPSTPTADTAVNPGMMPSPPNLPVTPPIDSPPMPADTTMPDQPAPETPATPPTEPK